MDRSAAGDEIAERTGLEETPMVANKNGDFVQAFLALGDQDRGFEILRPGIEDHDRSIVGNLLSAPDYDPLRGDSRFIELVEHLQSKVTHTDSYVVSKLAISNPW